MSLSFKGKRKSSRQKRGQALPEKTSSGQCHVGVFNGRAIEIEVQESIKDLHENGCFGTSSVTKSTPLCLWQRTTDEGKEEKLLLFPEEAFFLSYALKCLEIRNKEGRVLTNDECLQEFLQIHSQFISSFIIYTYLRSKNWIIKSGIKFGGDFLAYRRGPEHFHATFLVLLQSKTPLQPVKLQCIQRVSQTSGKDVLLLQVIPEPGANYKEYLENRFSSFQVAESIPNRFIIK